MKIVAIIARILLGLTFFVFGLNGFLNFIPAHLPGGVAGDFLITLIHSHYILLIAATEVIGGLLLLINRFVLLGLALLAPVLVNILAYHLTMDHSGLPVAIFAAILWGIVAWRLRAYFAPLFEAKAVEK